MLLGRIRDERALADTPPVRSLVSELGPALDQEPHAKAYDCAYIQPEVQ